MVRLSESDLLGKSRGRETPQAKAEVEAPEFMKKLATAIYEARTQRHLTIRQMADQIEISESALRRIENLTSHNTRGETFMAVMLWAARHGYREFAGFNIKSDTGENILRLVESQEAVHG